MSRKLILFYMLFSAELFAAGMTSSPEKCGEYTVQGVIRLREDDLRLVVHEKTLSEIVISFDKYELGQLTPFLDKPVTINVLLNKKFNFQKGSASQILGEASLRVADPMNPKDTGFMLKKAVPCLK